ncbi:MAG: glycoside hydrolase family 2 protein [Cyclobacteriaceae bacterium]|nr:glycoside hydrolase family 2 protein [Cyclobacteriaceae bacterium]UYN85477.1 MAG: glycoside hydrolase family 2 protein [Cyclobacteriaceae bacterium]
MKNLSIAFCLAVTTSVFGQQLKPGGLQGDKHIILTPSSDENKKLEGKSVYKIDYVGFKETDRSFQFTPTLPENWNWIAIFNAPLKGKKVNTFFYDSWVATDQPKTMSSGRRRNFDQDITKHISSNAYHIGFQRKQAVENEIFLLVVSPVKQKVMLEFDEKTLGVKRTLTYDMEAQEAKFVHIVIPPQEYTVVTWKPEHTSREVRNISSDWRFHKGDVSNAHAPEFNDSNWEDINLPHTWNTNDLFDYRNYKDVIDVTEMIYRGIGWYRKTFTVDNSWKDKHIKIDFLGANQVAEVWLNGNYVGKHVGGYTGFHFGDVFVKHIRFDKPNVVAVKVDNRFNYDIPPHTADYNMVGGIYRDVLLVAHDQVFVKEAKIFTPEVSPTSATVQANITVRNMGTVDRKATLVINIISPYNEIIASDIRSITLKAGDKPIIQQMFTVSNPLLWSPEYPHLYRVSATLYEPSDWQRNGKAIDQQFYPLGFRSLNFDSRNGLSLNDKHIKLKGVNLHQDFMHKSWAVDSAQKREDMLHIKRMGANYVRLSHYPHHPYVMHLCDSLGLMIWSEIPVVNTIGREKYIENAVKMMEELILRDINHPSIIMWGVGNEYYRNFFTKEDAEYALKVTQAVAKKAKEMDPYRPTVQAQNDLIDERILPLTDIQGRNRYFGWYEKTYNDFDHEMKEEHKKHPDWKLLVSEYGAEGKYGYHVNNPALFDHSETYQVALHRAYWNSMRDNDFILGGTIWNMFDFASFAKVGSIPHINQKGMMTYDRKPKSVYYYYQSQWTNEPMVYIYSHTWTHRSGEAGKRVEVFSNCDEVELFVNGKSQGKRKQTDGLLWTVNLADGLHDLRAVGTKQGETVKTDQQIYYQQKEFQQQQARVKPTGDG